MREVSCDVAVVGAGTAGIAAYRAASEAGAHAVLIEAGPGGTTCARVGCMPSKLLITAATAAHDAARADRLGIRVGDIRIDGRAVLARVRTERDRFVQGVLEKLQLLPTGDRIAGRARFADEAALLVDDHTRVRFRAAVIATGSSPIVPEPLRNLGERVLTTDTLFEIDDLPRSLAVLGGGPVGLEIAQAMARLGVEVCLFDNGHALAALSDPDLVALAPSIFGTEMTLHLDTTVAGAEPLSNGLRLGWSNASGRTGEQVFEHVLAAVGRAPNVRSLGLDGAGLRSNDKGGPRFDPRTLLCEGGPVFIAGDANAERPVLHEAARQGRIAGCNAAALAAGGPAGIEAPEPWVKLGMVFTHPGTASVGESHDPDGSAERLVGRADFSQQGRARIMDRAAGGLRIYADTAGRRVGAEMLGPAAEHLGHVLALAIQDGLTARALRDRPFYHPTLEEALDTALAQIVEAQE